MVTVRGSCGPGSDPRHAVSATTATAVRAAPRAVRYRYGMAYLVTTVKSSKCVTESALVQTPTRPAAGNVASSTSYSATPLRDTSKLDPVATTRKVLHWPAGTFAAFP